MTKSTRSSSFMGLPHLWILEYTEWQVSTGRKRCENEKKRAYEQRIRETKHSLLTPLVFSTMHRRNGQTSNCFLRTGCCNVSCMRNAMVTIALGNIRVGIGCSQWVEGSHIQVRSLGLAFQSHSRLCQVWHHPMDLQRCGWRVSLISGWSSSPVFTSWHSSVRRLSSEVSQLIMADNWKAPSWTRKNMLDRNIVLLSVYCSHVTLHCKNNGNI